MLEMFEQTPKKVFKQKTKLLHFDKCVFPYCGNRKHNSNTLFRFPSNPQRQKVWLDVIDNPLLVGYSASYLTAKAGVCKNHFHPHSFTNEEQNKLQRCAIPIRFNDQRTTNFYTKALNLCINDYKSTEIIGDLDNGILYSNDLTVRKSSMHTNYNLTVRNCNIYSSNLIVRDSGIVYLTDVSSRAGSIKGNDENMNFVNVDPKSYNTFSKDINRNAIKIANFESGVYLNNNYALNNNVAAGVRKSQLEISVSPTSDDVPGSKTLKRELISSDSKEQNVTCKRKLTEDAKLKREKLHYFVKLMNDRKNVQFTRDLLN